MKIYFLKLLYQILFTKIDEEPSSDYLSTTAHDLTTLNFGLEEALAKVAFLVKAYRDKKLDMTMSNMGNQLITH